jgi:hypothetical protein
MPATKCPTAMISGPPVAVADIDLIFTFAGLAGASGLPRPRCPRISPSQSG